METVVRVMKLNGFTFSKHETPVVIGLSSNSDFIYEPSHLTCEKMTLFSDSRWKVTFFDNKDSLSNVVVDYYPGGSD